MCKNTLLCTLILIFVAPLLLVGCDSEDPQAAFCPSTSNHITWNSYGHFTLKEEGRDATARDIVEACGWHVHNNHNGGYGNTLQVASPNEEVIFVWAYNSFNGFNVEEGWNGTTARGAYIGMDTVEFHTLHPEFSVQSITSSIFNDGTNRAEVFFEDGLLTRIYVGRYLRY